MSSECETNVEYKEIVSQSLSHNNLVWKIRCPSKDIELEYEVPSSVFEALIEKNIIEDPFYGINEKKVKWVFDSNWEYETTFSVEDKIFEKNVILLRFYGIDTVSDIFLNGEKIAHTDNMHKTYTFSVKHLLKRDHNSLKIILYSPTMEALNAVKEHGINLVNGMGIVPGVAYIRKAQYSYGWDWGPQLPDLGIWKEVELIGTDAIVFDNIYPRYTFFYKKNNKILTLERNQKELNALSVQECNNLTLEKVVAHVLFQVINYDTKRSLSELDYSVLIEFKDPINGTIICSEEKNLKEETLTFEWDLKNPRLWWTYDLGTPFRYHLEYKIKNDKGQIIYNDHIYTGVREITLVRKKDKWGETFFFKLNGIPLFARGANWIPVDSFIPRGKKRGLYEMNLKAVKKAHMNMLRVWGGGIYEDDIFYEWCDREGILVWQDFPFACSVYPPFSSFHNNVREEAIQNIKRLRRHPSLALWCGNNEIESFYRIYSLRIFSFKKRKEYKNGYRKLFEQMLPTLVRQLDPDKPYWPSSPSSGSAAGLRGIFGSNSPNYGDSHYWMVWHGGFPFSAYRKFNSRFMSEFGFESFPSLKTLQAFAKKEDFYFNSPVMENHQKNAAGNKKILNYMKKRFHVPSSFEKQVILSQITQAEAIEYGVEHWRRNRNDYHCMGSLYWQLNDCWPVASWSSIDYYGRWKALHYYASQFYYPLFPSIKEEKHSFEAWLTNDFRFSVTGQFICRLYNVDGEIVFEEKKDVEISPLVSQMILSSSLKEQSLEKISCKNILIFCRFEPDETSHERIKKETGITPHPIESFRLFTDPKEFHLKDPELSYKIEKETEDSLTISIESKHIALFVCIDHDEIDFIASENYFIALPGIPKKITLTPQALFGKDLEDPRKHEVLNRLKEELTITSLYELQK